MTVQDINQRLKELYEDSRANLDEVGSEESPLGLSIWLSGLVKKINCAKSFGDYDIKLRYEDVKLFNMLSHDKWLNSLVRALLQSAKNDDLSGWSERLLDLLSNRMYLIISLLIPAN